MGAVARCVAFPRRGGSAVCSDFLYLFKGGFGLPPCQGPGRRSRSWPDGPSSSGRAGGEGGRTCPPSARERPSAGQAGQDRNRVAHSRRSRREGLSATPNEPVNFGGYATARRVQQTGWLATVRQPARDGTGEALFQQDNPALAIVSTITANGQADQAILLSQV